MKNKKNERIKLAAFWFFAFAVIIFMMSLRTYAAETYFPMGQNDNNKFTQTDIDKINSYFDGENNFLFIVYDSYTPQWGPYYVKYFWVYQITKETDGTINTFAEINSNGYQFSLYELSNNNPTITKYYYDNYANFIGVNTNGSMNNMQNLTSSLYDSNNSYISNFSLYTDNTKNRKVVLSYGTDNDFLHSDGHATEPINNPNNFITDSQGNRIDRPNTPTINNYSWTTYNSPSVDNSSVESLLESTIDILNYLVGYLTTNLSNEFDNMITNLTNLFNYAVESVENGFNNIVSAIQDLADDIYNNMVSLFEPIAENIGELKEKLENVVENIGELKDKIEEIADLFIHPFDEEEFEEQIENSSFLSAYNELKDNSDILNEMFANAQERDHFSLYISFENPFADSEHKIISSEINFDWLVPLRSVYRPFLWVCICFELFMGGARVLSSVIGGKVK